MIFESTDFDNTKNYIFEIKIYVNILKVVVLSFVFLIRKSFVF